MKRVSYGWSGPDASILFEFFAGHEAAAELKFGVSEAHGFAGDRDRHAGDFGIQSLDRGRVPANQIEAARIAISRSLKRKGKMWMRIFPHTPVTKKPAEVRMGSGKGSVEYYVACIKPGTMLFEVGGVPITVAREAMRLADTKLQLRCRFVAREELEKY